MPLGTCSLASLPATLPRGSFAEPLISGSHCRCCHVASRGETCFSRSGSAFFLKRQDKKTVFLGADLSYCRSSLRRNDGGGPNCCSGDFDRRLSFLAGETSGEKNISLSDIKAADETVAQSLTTTPKTKGTLSRKTKAIPKEETARKTEKRVTQKKTGTVEEAEKTNTMKVTVKTKDTNSSSVVFSDSLTRAIAGSKNSQTISNASMKVESSKKAIGNSNPLVSALANMKASNSNSNLKTGSNSMSTPNFNPNSNPNSSSNLNNNNNSSNSNNNSISIIKRQISTLKSQAPENESSKGSLVDKSTTDISPKPKSKVIGTTQQRTKSIGIVSSNVTKDNSVFSNGSSNSNGLFSDSTKTPESSVFTNISFPRTSSTLGTSIAAVRQNQGKRSVGTKNEVLSNSNSNLVGGGVSASAIMGSFTGRWKRSGDSPATKITTSVNEGIMNNITRTSLDARIEGIVDEVVQKIGVSSEADEKLRQKVLRKLVREMEIGDLREVMKGFGQRKEWQLALSLFRNLKKQYGDGLLPGVYAVVVHYLSHLGQLNVAEEILDEMDKGPVKAWPMLYATIIRKYITMGDPGIQRAMSLFGTMRNAGHKGNLALYSMLILACANSAANLESAVKLIEQMEEEGFQPTSDLYEAVLGSLCSSRDYSAVEEYLEKLESLGTVNLTMYNMVLRVYAMKGLGKDALKLFRRVMLRGFRPDTESYGMVISALGRRGSLKEVREVHDMMLENGVQPTESTYHQLVLAYGKASAWREMEGILEQARASGLAASPEIGKALVAVYGRAGRLDEVERVMEALRERHAKLPLGLYHRYLEAYTLNHKGNFIADVARIISEMEARSIPLGEVAYASLILALGSLGHFEQVKGLVQAANRALGKPPGSILLQALLAVFGRGGQVEDMWAVVDYMREQKIHIHAGYWNIILMAVREAPPEEVEKVFEASKMQSRRASIRASTILLESYCRYGQFDKAWEVYKSMGVQQRDIPSHVYERLLDACWWEGREEEGETLLATMLANGIVPSISSFCALIGVHGANGEWEKARVTFQKMESMGLVPNLRAFTLLFDAFILSRRVNEGIELAERMKTGGFFLPALNGLIRLYGSCGLLDEMLETYAEAVNGNGTEADGDTYATLLEICILNGKVEEALAVGKQAVEKHHVGSLNLVSAMLGGVSAATNDNEFNDFMELLRNARCPEPVCRMLLGKEGDVETGNEKEEKERKENARDENESRSGKRKDVEDIDALKKYIESFENRNLYGEVQRKFVDSLVGALWLRGRENKAAQVLKLGVNKGMYPGLSKKIEKKVGKRSEWVLKLSQMSPASAQIILLAWLGILEKRVISGEDIPDIVVILLGGDKVLRDLEVKEVVLRQLRDLDAPFRIDMEKGNQIFAEGTYVAFWLSKQEIKGRLVVYDAEEKESKSGKESKSENDSSESENENENGAGNEGGNESEASRKLKPKVSRKVEDVEAPRKLGLVRKKVMRKQ